MDIRDISYFCIWKGTPLSMDIKEALYLFYIGCSEKFFIVYEKWFCALLIIESYNCYSMRNFSESLI